LIGQAACVVLTRSWATWATWATNGMCACYVTATLHVLAIVAWMWPECGLNGVFHVFPLPFRNPFQVERRLKNSRSHSIPGLAKHSVTLAASFSHKWKRCRDRFRTVSQVYNYAPTSRNTYRAILVWCDYWLLCQDISNSDMFDLTFPLTSFLQPKQFNSTTTAWMLPHVLDYCWNPHFVGGRVAIVWAYMQATLQVYIYNICNICIYICIYILYTK
jgi:hypothetical protein